MIGRPIHPALLALGAFAALGAATPLLDNYALFVAGLVGVYIIFATGYNLLMGTAGQFDVGQCAFLGIGAYATALLQTRLSLPFAVALPAGACLSVLAGMTIGVIVLRLRHFYLALVTLAFSQSVVLVLILWRDLTNGFQGVAVPRIVLPGLTRSESIYLIVAALTVLMVWMARNLIASRIGHAFVAIRESEVAAQAAGIDLTRYRLMAYGISAFYGGIAGGLLASLITHITPQSFDIGETIKLLAMIVVGGMGSLLGSILGAVVLTIGGELMRFSKLLQEIGYGVLLLGAILLAPEGIAGLLRRARTRWAERRTLPSGSA